MTEEKTLQQFILETTERGSCQCGKCLINNGSKTDEEMKHRDTVSVHFFDVSLADGIDKDAAKSEFLDLLKTYGDEDLRKRLHCGVSYLESGAVLGGQGIALLMIGLGKLLGVWEIITPATMGFSDEKSAVLAGNGLVMNSNWE